MSKRLKPYHPIPHYDASVRGVLRGFGKDLNPACGQSGIITVTSVASDVECGKCLKKLPKVGD